jgi:aryl-alcohol dehydrogenase-like predicted oxidoreductase
MQYRRLGKTDLSVSAICLGTMTWGMQNSEGEGHAQMDYAFDQGVNFWDTAEMYPIPVAHERFGKTESIIGSWFKKSGKRDKIILATKIVGPDERFTKTRDGINRFTRANLLAAIDGSLKRLGTDYIDLYQLHWPERTINAFGRLYYEHDDEDFTPFEDVLRVLEDAVKEGKVRHVGLSNETAWGAMRWLQLAEAGIGPRMVSIQNCYHLMNRMFEVGLAEVAIREQCGLLAFSPLGMGTLSGKYLNGARPEGARMTLFPNFARYMAPRAQEAIAAHVALARKYGLDPAQMALAWINGRDFVTANIIGATNLNQLKSNIASIDVKLPPELVKEIEELHKVYTIPVP